MAEKDILEKVLMLHADVFADCENVLSYGGTQRLRALELQPAPTESFYWGGDREHNQFCDVSFFRMENGEVKAQLESEKPAYPVVCMVFDWTRKNTHLPMSLKELLAQDGASDDELELTDDIKLSVYHMSRLSKEVRSRFTSDMGFVVDFLNEGNFEGRMEQRVVHVEALCKMMHALTGDSRFTDLVGELMSKQEEGKEIYMCEYIDILEAKGETRLAQLIQLLLAEQKFEEIEQAARDSSRRKELYQTYGI